MFLPKATPHARWPRGHRRDRTQSFRERIARFERLEDRTVLSTFVVTSLADIGPGTLRTAISLANSNPGSDEIEFSVAGTINILNGSFPLPTLSDSSGGTVIDATTAPGYVDSPVVYLRGPGGGMGIEISSANNEVRGLHIGLFDRGVRISGPNASQNVIVANYIGTDGLAATPNQFAGVEINGANGNRIGTNGDGVDDVAERNIISGNAGGGVVVAVNSNGNVVAGNYIGTNASGSSALANGTSTSAAFRAGVHIFEGSNNRIGTDGDGNADTSERNLISGNSVFGVQIFSGNNNVIAGNFIGTDSTGTSPVGNFGGIAIGAAVGSSVGGANNNRIGTNADGIADDVEGNLISSNIGGGIGLNASLSGNTTNGNTIAGNLIGTDASGTLGLGNGSGVFVGTSVTNTRIGTNGDNVTDEAERNVISGNTGGVGVNSVGLGTIIAGNFIGTDISGTQALGNAFGVAIANGLVGTNADGVNDAGERNIISANTNVGAFVGTGGNLAGNYIGTDVSGTLALGNGSHGVEISHAPNGRIGTNADAINDLAERNVISANGGSGVRIRGNAATNNTVSGNVIGTDVSGINPLPNQFHGVLIEFDASNNIVGGATSSATNVIAFNLRDGIALVSDSLTPFSTSNPPVHNRIQLNSIHSNGELGIDLTNNGVSSNDIADVDVGPNDLQNFPILASASPSGGDITIAGSLNSVPNTTFTLEFFSSATADPSGFGEGESFIGSATVVTDGVGNASFSVSFAVAVPVGHFITATAIDTLGNTSEFSCARRFALNSPPSSLGDSYSVSEDSTFDVPAPGVLDNDSDADDDALTAILATEPTHGVLTLDANGSFRYTPNSNFNGTDTFNYIATDGQADGNTATVTINVAPVNDVPFFDAIANQSVNEDGGLQNVAISGISPGPGNEAGQTVTLSATSSDPTIVPNPSILGSGSTRTLSYEPAADANGTVTITVTANDGQSANNIFSRTFTITVNAVNDVPFFDAIANQSVNEDGGLQNVAISGISPGPGNEAGQTVTLSATSSDPTIVPNPSILGSGSTRTLSYEPAADANGTVTITVTANDGQSANNIFSRTFTITVNAVNDVPFFDAIANQSVNEDGGLQNVAISGISPGPGNEAGQTVTLSATSSDPTIVPNPSILGSGSTRTLSYEPAADANGTVTITVTANDGQSANNIFSRTFTITVNAVNDVPFFDAIANQSVNEDGGLQNVAISGISPGPGNEAGQTVTLSATSSDPTIVPNPSILGSGSTRTLSYEPAADANGTVTITVTANDGQSANNIFSRTFTITVESVNDAPVVADDSYSTVEDTTLIGSSVLVNDDDSHDGAPTENNTPLTAQLVDGPANAIAFTLNADGTFTYTPVTGFTGTDTFTYQAVDSFGEISAVATVSIEVIPARQIVEGQELTTSLWLNLANTDDIGTYFDVLVEAVDQNGEVFAIGMLDRFRAVRNPSAAESVVLTAFRTVAFDVGNNFSLRISVRIDEGPGHSSGRLQLKYDASTRSGAMSLDFGEGLSTYYLHENFQMDTGDDTGDSSVNTITKLAKKQNGNPWVEMGTWTGTVV